jgi:predicted amidohydrolase YtcJ
MKQKLFLIAVFLGACSQLIAQEGNSTLLLYNVNIINVVDGSINQNAAIVIKGGNILTIGKNETLRKKYKDSKKINGENKYVIPGLWDMHIHLEGADLIPDNKALLPVFLAYGITTVRDCASDLGEQVLKWRNQINHDSLVGPTIFTAGKKLEGKNSIWKGDLEIATEVELDQMLDLLDKYQVDFVKITENTLSGDLFLKSVQAAKARGYRVSGHVPYDLTISELVEAGFTSIEHASYMLRLGGDEEEVKQSVLSGKLTKGEAGQKYAKNFDQVRGIGAYEKLGQQGLFVCPTLIGSRQLAFLDENDHQKDDFLKYLTQRFTSNYAWRINRMASDTDEQKQQRKDSYELVKMQLPNLQKAGIKIIAGSDAAALNTYVYPAESLIDELMIFKEAGLTPLEILQAATINGARYFGKLDTMASVEEGKVADLVLLDKNPLQDITAIKSIYTVIKKGHYYDRVALDEMLQQAVNTKLILDQERR